MEIIDDRFFSSITLTEHPMIHLPEKLKTNYYCLLKLFASSVYSSDFTYETLGEYKKYFNIQAESCDPETKQFAFFLKPWRRKYILLLKYDIYLVNGICSVNDNDVKTAVLDTALRFCKKNQYKSFCRIIERFFNMQPNDKLFSYGETLRKEVDLNKQFVALNTRRLIITANMSSGKSTIINAIIGKKIAKTSIEVCTSNVSYILNKPFEDNHIHMMGNSLTINANEQCLMVNDWEKEKYIASFFNLSHRNLHRFCLIDTPGVNSSMNRQHGQISRNVLKQKEYDVIIYVLNAQQLGTDEEIKHLKWIKNNVSDCMIVFALNKLDVFKTKEDNIQNSTALVKNDLEKIGFEDPIICPISAYFAFLVKKKKFGVELSEDEQDEYEFYSKKFNKPAHDLSGFYQYPIDKDDDETTVLLKKCGFYGFEKIISGG